MTARGCISPIIMKKGVKDEFGLNFFAPYDDIIIEDLYRREI